jgi:hypothetical protein
VTKHPDRLLACPRQCVSAHTFECILRTEITYYSGRVGALDHLAEIARPRSG